MDFLNKGKLNMPHIEDLCCSGNIGICMFQYLIYANRPLARMVVVAMALDRCISVNVQFLSMERIARVSIIYSR